MAFGARGGGGSRNGRGGVYYRRGRYRYSRYYFITDFLILFLAIITFVLYNIYAYKTSFEDPILTLKNTFINFQIFSTLTILITNIILMYELEDHRKLRNLLITLLILLVVLIIGQSIWKFILDLKYTQNEFINLYETLKISEISKNDYVKENLTAYKNFTLKYYINLTFQIVIILLNFIFIFKTLQSVKKIEEREKNDAILFDEETNIKV